MAADSFLIPDPQSIRFSVSHYRSSWSMKSIIIHFTSFTISWAGTPTISWKAPNTG